MSTPVPAVITGHPQRYLMSFKNVSCVFFIEPLYFRVYIMGSIGKPFGFHTMMLYMRPLFRSAFKRDCVTRVEARQGSSQAI